MLPHRRNPQNLRFRTVHSVAAQCRTAVRTAPRTAAAGRTAPLPKIASQRPVLGGARECFAAPAMHLCNNMFYNAPGRYQLGAGHVVVPGVRRRAARKAR